METQERDDVLRALVCVACQLLADVQHTCLRSFTWGPSVAECNRRAKLGCIEVLAMRRERGDAMPTFSPKYRPDTRALNIVSAVVADSLGSESTVERMCEHMFEERRRRCRNATMCSEL